VERISWDGGQWRLQEVALGADRRLELHAGAALEPQALEELAALGLDAAASGLPSGWSTELHPSCAPWLEAAGAGLIEGHLVVVDYALEARRYYAPSRRAGTLLAYRNQRASPNPLLDPGHWDLTAHLCLESLERSAAATGWWWQGSCRQGQALLALGLAQALHGLQSPAHPQDLAGPDAHLVNRFGDFHTAPFAPSACMDLRLDHPNGSAQGLSRMDRFGHAQAGNAARHLNAITLQNFFALVFVDFHCSVLYRQAGARSERVRRGES
jgi:hypothetical protein